MTKCEIFITELAVNIEQFRQSSSTVLTTPEKVILDEAYQELGGVPLDKNCKACVTEVFQRTINILDMKKPSVTIDENHSGEKTVALTDRIKSDQFFKATHSMTNNELLHILKKAKQPEPRNASKNNLINSINDLKLPIDFK